MCDKWVKSFESFYRDMGDPPLDDMSIERIDNTGDYEPSNCKWATQKEQCRNKRNNRLMEWGGLRLTVAEWAEVMQINIKTLESRVRRSGSIFAEINPKTTEAEKERILSYNG